MLAGVTRRDRHQATTAVIDAITDAGGWLADSTRFSNIAITLRFTIPAGSLAGWGAALAAAGVVLDDESRASLVDRGQTARDPDVEVTAALSLTFIHNEPDLRQEVPAVPG